MIWVMLLMGLCFIMQRVLLVDDHALILDGLQLVITDVLGECTVTQAQSYDRALQIIHSAEPFEWIFADILMPENSGIDLLREIRSRGMNTMVIMISGSDDASLIRRSIDAGANGFLPKRTSHKDLPRLFKECVDSVNRGIVYTPEETKALLKDYEASIGLYVKNIRLQLSDKQRDVLTLLFHGYSNTEIGQALGLAESTIKFHVSKLYSVLNVSSRTECVAEVRRLGLV